MYRFREEVFRIAGDGCVRLLDFRQGRFYALDPVADRLLALVFSEGEQRAQQLAAEEYDVAEVQVKDDLQSLLNNLSSAKLIRKSTQQEKESRSWFRAPLESLLTPSWSHDLDCGFALCHVDRLLNLAWFSLRLIGWTETVKRWSRPTDVGHSSLDKSRCRRIDHLVRLASHSRWLISLSCKERAIVGYFLARQYGQPAELVIGVQQFPFLAHAWVEVHGHILTDDPEHCALFVPVTRYQ